MSPSSKLQYDESGFTIIELITVTAIVGILALIALFPLAPLKGGAFDSMAKTDLRTLVTAEEALFAATEAYAVCANTAACEAALPGFVASGDVEVAAAVPAPGTVLLTAQHPKGRTVWVFDSAVGTIVAQ
jgi:prepilin-type N-terminal cleavage/methylation domain-containing protein